jgi:hypothetical protein
VNPENELHLERAVDLLQVAEDTLRDGHYPDSISRSYYAMFHSATAVLKTMGIERKSHHGLWAAFGQFVTAPKLMETKFHRAGIEAFTARARSDYLPQPANTAESAANLLDQAREFVDACCLFVRSRP